MKSSCIDYTDEECFDSICSPIHNPSCEDVYDFLEPIFKPVKKDIFLKSVCGIADLPCEDSKAKRQRWDSHESERLMQICMVKEVKDWDIIATEFPGFTKKQVMRHYYELAKSDKWSKRLCKKLECQDIEKSIKEFSDTEKKAVISKLKEKLGEMQSKLEYGISKIGDLNKKYNKSN